MNDLIRIKTNILCFGMNKIDESKFRSCCINSPQNKFSLFSNHLLHVRFASAFKLKHVEAPVCKHMYLAFNKMIDIHIMRDSTQS